MRPRNIEYETVRFKLSVLPDELNRIPIDGRRRHGAAVIVDAVLNLDFDGDHTIVGVEYFDIDSVTVSVNAGASTFHFRFNVKQKLWTVQAWRPNPVASECWSRVCADERIRGKWMDRLKDAGEELDGALKKISALVDVLNKRPALSRLKHGASTIVDVLMNFDEESERVEITVECLSLGEVEIYMFASGIGHFSYRIKFDYVKKVWLINAL